MKKRRANKERPVNVPTSGISQVMEIEEAQRERREKRIASMSPKAARRYMEALERDEESARKNFLTGKRLSFAVASIVVVVTISVSGLSIWDLKKESTEAERTLIAKQEERERLESEYTMVNNLEYIETQARERLKMIKPGEILYIFDESDAADEV